MQKKENAKYNEEISEFRTYIAGARGDEEVIDLNNIKENERVGMPPI
jgi:hypothetical protein